MEKHCVGDGLFSDITFELDDEGQMKAHRAILIARCDVMRAMLAGDFREAHSSVVCYNKFYKIDLIVWHFDKTTAFASLRIQSFFVRDLVLKILSTETTTIFTKYKMALIN